MSQFAKEPPYSHGTAPKIGILLINLGSPEAATPGAVRTASVRFGQDTEQILAELGYSPERIAEFAETGVT